MQPIGGPIVPFLQLCGDLFRWQAERPGRSVTLDVGKYGEPTPVAFVYDTALSAGARVHTVEELAQVDLLARRRKTLEASMRELERLEAV